ncbi:hypothetical protein BY458DRAFT_510474 [Sporodiniella umbellata]|nr:hypothetical protein BY458DRAFT_510474 [Sporodiniella umbellata]
MNRLYQLLCVPKAPTLSIQDLKENNFGSFVDKSMRAAPHLAKDQQLKGEATEHMHKLLAGKSNSASNTLRTVQTLFESASKACHSDQDRALIDWLQVCVSTAVEIHNDPVSAAEKTRQAANPPMTEKPLKTPSPPKKTGKKTTSPVDDDASWVESDEEDWDSEDDYLPENNEDAIVPVKKTRKKKIPKKTSSDQKVPKESPKLSLIQEGAGPKAIHKYFNEMALTSKTDLPSGYFVRSFFFPSKDSFSAFLSVLNSATKTIDICVFAFTDDDVADVLIAAKKRNVAIRIITDNQQAAGKGADAKRLSESYGIPFKTDHTTGYMHNKFAMIDNKTLINGSFNWSKGARFKNRENVMITNIPFCIQEFQKQFDALWEEF